MGLFGDLLSAFVSGSSESNDRDCDWFCDNCDTYMNDQPGFTATDDTWTCTKCGHENDVSEGNVFDPWNRDSDN